MLANVSSLNCQVIVSNVSSDKTFYF